MTRPRGPDSILKNAASSFVAQLTTASLTAVLTLFLVRALGPKQYGLFALSVATSAIALTFADVGISNSVTRFVAEHRGDDAALHTLIGDALKLKVISAGFLCALLAALASVISSAYGNQELVWPLRVIALATFGQSTYLMLLGVATALGRSAVNVRLVAAESLLEALASIGLVVTGAGAIGAALGRSVGYVFGAVLAAYVIMRLGGRGPVRLWRRPRPEIVRQVGSYARSVFAIDASYTLSSTLSVLLVGVYAGSVASGVYQAPAKLITLIAYVGLAIANGVGPRLTRGPGQEPDVRALHRALRGLIVFQCLMLAPAVVWAKPITRVLLGSGYSKSADVLAALAPYIFFCGLGPLVTLGVNYVGEAQRRIPISLATLALTVAGCFILIPRYGVVGAAVATDIALGFYVIAHIWLCRRLFKLRIGMLVWSLACGLTAAAAMGVVLASVGTTNLTIGGLLKGSAGGVAAFVGMLMFTREIRGADIARAMTAVAAQFARVNLGPGSTRWTRPLVLPLAPGGAATTAIADARGLAVPKDLISTSFVAAESAVASLTERSGSGEVVKFPMTLSRAPRHRARVRHWLVAGAVRMRSSLHGFFRRRLRRSGLEAPERPSSPMATLFRRTSSIASPPRFEDVSSESSQPVPEQRLGVEHVEKDHHATNGNAAVAIDNRPWPRSRSSRADTANTSRCRSNVVYQIVWRLRDGIGVFELRPVEGSESRDDAPGTSPATEQSPPVRWRWRMPPAPMPDAQCAHAALIDSLLAAGWGRVGMGDAWFADLFRPPLEHESH